jgi:hypothetical protein
MLGHNATDTNQSMLCVITFVKTIAYSCILNQVWFLKRRSAAMLEIGLPPINRNEKVIQHIYSQDFPSLDHTARHISVSLGEF